MNPKYPIYIISKGRWESRQTSKAFEKLNIPYHIVVEPQEYDNYASVIDPKKILVLPFSNLGKGSIPARNWVWQHSIEQGAKRHWIFDDNILAFYRLNRNKRIYVDSGTIFRCVEEFVDRYENVGMAGFNYMTFAPARQVMPPFRLNTRIYSMILLDNSVEHRWRGRYNEDTDLSIRILKSGMCTVLFNAFLGDKTATMTMKGGNTDELYVQNDEMDGRYLMAKSLQDQHPDIVKITQKWDRWQHHVDYTPFKRNKLVKKQAIVIKEGVDNFGMVLKRVEDLEEENIPSVITQEHDDNTLEFDIEPPKPFVFPTDLDDYKEPDPLPKQPILTMFERKLIEEEMRKKEEESGFGFDIPKSGVSGENTLFS